MRLPFPLSYYRALANLSMKCSFIPGGRRRSAGGTDRGIYNGKSVVLNGTDNGYQNTTLPAEDSRQVFSIHYSFKPSELTGPNVAHWMGGVDNNNKTIIKINSNRIQIQHQDAAVDDTLITTTQVLRDTHHFYDILVLFDSTEAAGADRIKLYVDGVENTVWDDTTYPTSGKNFDVNGDHFIGNQDAAGLWLNGYMANFHYLDNILAAPTDFGHVSADTGAWVPHEYTGSYGAIGYSLKFEDNGNDSSGNGNNFADVGTPAYSNSTMIDNFPTWNPLISGTTGTYSIGNQTIAWNNAENGLAAIGMMIDAGDDWEMSFNCDDDGGGGVQVSIGIEPILGIDGANTAGNDANGYAYRVNGDVRNNGTSGAYGATYTTGDDITVRLHAGTLTFYKNGVTQGTAASGLTGKFFFSAGDSSGSDGGGFTILPDASLVASPLRLSSANIPEPTNKLPQDNANIVLYTGDGVDPLAVSGVGFQPDFTWLKNRDQADEHVISDSVRGVGVHLSSDSTDVEETLATAVESFDSDGFTLGNANNVNTNAEDYWSLNILADNTAGSSNTDGTITSTVATDGLNFSIVTYTGTGVAATIGHGLASAPDMIIVKERTDDGGSWMVYHSANTAAPETDYLHLDSTNATTDNSNRWNDTAPTSTVFSVGDLDDVSGSGDTYVAYCFKFGEVFAGGVYTGNGNADGTFIPTDELLMFLCKKTSGLDAWVIHDQIRSPINPAELHILADNAAAEVDAAAFDMDFLSNGMKMRGTQSDTNGSAATYIWWGIKKNGGQAAYN